MKRFFSMLIMLAITFSANAACKTVMKALGQDDGSGGLTYRDVTENSEHTILTCYHPGTNKCKWKDGTIAMVISVGGTPMTEDQIETDILDKIDVGELSGTIMGDNGASYSWVANSPNDYQFTICDGQ